jgi:phospho-N-acetylmuramoyl-pentapeptide-transferase
VRNVLIAAAAGFFFCLLGTPVAIRLFRAWGWGQRIREDGPKGHMEKMGRPTMGGIVMIGSVTAAYILARLISGGQFTAAGIATVGLMILLGLVGAADDLIKIRRRRSLGLNKTGKLIGQFVLALVFALVAVKAANIPTTLTFVRDTGVNLGIFFAIWVFVIIAASSNGVNLTDGLDGLASGSCALVLAAYVVIAFWQFRHTCGTVPPIAACYTVDGGASLDLALVAAGGLGAAAGFLWWNAAPARIFMGDTGAMALGGLLGGLAIMTETQLLLLILGGLFVLETTSVIVQVISFRTTGRRVFRMSPIHHHFELLGWPEFTVVVRFWIICGLAVATGLGVFYADFLARGGVT